jgi:predicted AAA+ superfamily ATPase
LIDGPPGLSETLAGRISYIELAPFSRREISGIVSQQKHWLYGGFPNALLVGKEEQGLRWLKAFVDTYLHRDLMELGHQFSIPVFRNLLSMLTVLNGNVLNVSDLSRSLGVSQPTVNRYLDLLEGSFVINRLQPYFINVTKRLVKAPKVYVRDSGILHSLAKIISYEQLLGHPLVGASWEGYVIEQIRRVTGNDWEYFYYRTHKGAETDLVLITPKGKKVCVEIKFSANPSISRGFYETINDILPDFQFIVVPEPMDYGFAISMTSWAGLLVRFVLIDS